MYMYVCDIISLIILLFQLHVNSLIINSIRFTNGYCDVHLIKCTMSECCPIYIDTFYVNNDNLISMYVLRV